MGQIKKGIIVSISGATARVQESNVEGTTLPLIIPSRLRELHKGTEVAYTTFDDGTGIVLERMEGGSET